MSDLLVCIYMVRFGEHYRGFFTHDPEVDAEIILQDESGGYLDLLTPFLPIGLIYHVFTTLFTPNEMHGCKIKNCTEISSLRSWFSQSLDYKDILFIKTKKITKLLQEIAKVFEMNSYKPDSNAFPARYYPKQLTENRKRCYERYGLEAVRKALNGRILFLEELGKSLIENGYETKINVMNILQYLALNGEVEVLPSVGFSAPGEITCYRCENKIKLKTGFTGQTEVFNKMYMTRCPVCSFLSLYCEQCNSLGQARMCRGLYAMKGRSVPLIDKEKKFLDISLKLTPAQSKASKDLVKFVNDEKENECLLWAVTGAGKTEVVMAAMESVLQSGGQVLYATPRRDVVQEITPRLQLNFEELHISSNYGGSIEKFTLASIIVATTHQVVRYYKQFDLVILDEIDAYPYKDNKMLHRAVKRAAKTDAHIICLTATPDEETMAKVERGKSKLITIPARHHGHPVPEPRIMKLTSFVKLRHGGMTVDPFITELLHRWLKEGDEQIFVFLPTVFMVNNYGPILEQALKRMAEENETGYFQLSHAKDPFRDQKRENFKKGKIRIFVTTTIMERGVTVKKANVLVLEADFEQVFDEGTLIQMAGRAGRSAEFPKGEVVFVGRGISGAMKSALNKIRFFNRRAKQEGFI